MRFRFGPLVLLAALCASPAATTPAQQVIALPHLDANNLSGAWYEIARYPNKREKVCTGDAQELVTLDDKDRRLQLVDSCTAAKGYTETHNYIAKIDKQTDGKLKIPQFFPFSRPYWVLAMATDNSWLVIGEANHKSLWIFAKTPTLDPATLAVVEAFTTAAGFSTSPLVFSPQKGYTASAAQAVATPVQSKPSAPPPAAPATK